jgi:hypothetical protein
VWLKENKPLHREIESNEDALTQTEVVLSQFLNINEGEDEGGSR